MGLRNNILNEPVSELDIRVLIDVSGETTVRQAIGMMQDKSIGCVVIVDIEGRPQGTFTERLLVKTLLCGDDQLDQPVSNFLGRRWAKVCTTDKIAQLIQVMQTHALRFVVVVDDDGKAVGITGQRGLMEYIAEHYPRQVKAQEMEANIHIEEREGG